MNSRIFGGLLLLSVIFPAQTMEQENRVVEERDPLWPFKRPYLRVDKDGNRLKTLSDDHIEEKICKEYWILRRKYWESQEVSLSPEPLKEEEQPIKVLSKQKTTKNKKRKRKFRERVYVKCFCSNGYASLSSYQRHIKDDHPERCPYFCEQCGRGFFAKYIAHQHKEETRHLMRENFNETTS